MPSRLKRLRYFPHFVTYFDSTFREILELKEARKEILLGPKEYAYSKIQKLRK
jgi:hypothetical protein